MADSQVPVGRRRARGRGERAGVEVQAELVPGRDRRQDDPAAGAASWPARRGRGPETAGSHAIYVSQPDAVADLIEKAATAVSN